MKLLVDNNLPPVLGRGLGALFNDEHLVIHMKDKFGTGSLPDEKWIELLGSEGGWCVLSGDRRIATKKPSRDLFNRNNLIGFFPAPAVLELPLPKLAARVLAVWDRMEAITMVVDRGCYDLTIRGTKFQPIG